MMFPALFKRRDAATPATPTWKAYQAQIDALANLPLNFEFEKTHDYTVANGWRVDDYEAELPAEPPGAPIPNGPWEIAKRMIHDYKFPDPKIVTGIFVPEDALEKRVMLLRAHAYGLTFYFGVRVGDVIDETRDDPQTGEQQRVWGFNYRTLQGHYERGQIDFTVIKGLTSGKVAFHIHAFSQAGEIRNLIIRIGFRLLGRRVQKRFARRAMERMQTLVRDELASQAKGQASSAAASIPTVPIEVTNASGSSDAKAGDKLAEVSGQAQQAVPTAK